MIFIFTSCFYLSELGRANILTANHNYTNFYYTDTEIRSTITGDTGAYSTLGISLSPRIACLD